jgi:PadR family transcriptional regulator
MNGKVDIMARRVEKDFFSGSIRLHILHHASRGPVFGAGIIEELQRHGYRISPGTLYPILHGLEGTGYLRSGEHLVHGKRRRSYLLTAMGKSALRLSRPRIVALLRELVGIGRSAQRPVAVRPGSRQLLREPTLR